MRSRTPRPPLTGALLCAVLVPISIWTVGAVGPNACEVEVRVLSEQGVDVYGCASSETTRPVLVYVPCNGDRTHTGWLAPLFTSLGFLFVSVDYGVTPGKAPPGHVEDAAERIAWTLRSIEAYGGDPGRLFVMGYSAGAHIAALIATDHRCLAVHGIELKAIRGVIVLDNDVFAPSSSGEGKRLDPWGDAAGETSSDWRDVSPGTHVAAGKGIPPMLIACSGVLAGPRADDVLGFVDLLAAAGVEVRLHIAEDRDHVSILFGLTEPEDETAAVIADFLMGILDR